MTKTKLIALSLVLLLLFNMIMPIITVVASSSYTITFTATEGHTLENDHNHLKIDGQYVDPREATNYIVNVNGNTATITINDGTATTLNFNADNKFDLFANNNKVDNGTSFSADSSLTIKDVDTSSYTLTFNLKNGLTGDNYTISSDGNHLKIGGVYIDLVDVSSLQTNIAASVNVAQDGKSATIVSAGSMAGVLNFNTDKFSLFANGEKVRENTIFDSNTSIQIEEYVNDNNDHGEEHGGDNTQNYHGNATATLNYKITGAIEYTSGGGFEHGISFRINDIPYAADESKMQYSEDTAYERDENGQLILDENNNPIVVRDPETMQPMTEKTGLTINGDTINYDYNAETNKVKFTFVMAPGTLMTGLKINGRTINNLPSTKEELAACYTDHRLEIEVDDIDYNATEYNIEITARYPNSNEEFLGNFLWDYNPKGYTGPEDKILNATLTFVEAEYNGHKYTTEEEINELGGIFIWRDAPRKNKYTDEREGVGEAQFPTGTKLTVKIIPDAGYQLIDFGINGGVFAPQEEIGTYTFEVQGGPFHLQATIAQVEDVVKSKSEKIASGSIKLGGQEEAMAIGTAKLEVDDVNLEKEQISNFEKAAEGYEISSYLDISLYNTVYKGKKTESWDTEVKNLDNEATISLKLEDGIDGNGIVIVHEKHDGTYEIIEIESYDEETNTITFKTKSFSNYAIASKTVSTEPTKTATDVKTNNPKTGDNIMLFVTLFVISVLGISVAIKLKK